MSKINLDFLEVTGNSFDRGKKYGKTKKESIELLVNYLYESYSKNKKNKEYILEHVRKHIPYIKEYSQEIYEEIQGIAEGSGKLLEEIIMIHMHEEKSGFSSHNCTTFASTGKATSKGETLIGQTWDISNDLCEVSGAFLLKEKISKSFNTLVYTYSGMIAGAGINSSGISLVWNSVPRLDIKIGVPTYIIIAEILRQDKIGDALASIFRAKRAGCFNFLIADNTELYSIEATPNDVGIIYSNDYLVHSNHYITEKFKEKQNIAEVAKKYSASTLIRYNKINSLLKEEYGNINIDSFKEFMCDHTNYPESICRHPDPNKDKDKRIISCSSFIMLPSNQEMWITNGPACETDFNKYIVKRRD